MSMLAHGFERPVDRAEYAAWISRERKVGLKRLAVGALTVLSMGAVLTALIALKVAIYVWHFHA
jgi:hypothetical protein